MPSLNDVYRKFGEVSEAAQLLETELGNLLLEHRASLENLIDEPSPERAAGILRSINRSTLGQLLRQMGQSTEALDDLEQLLAKALVARNRLAHSFYREHNNRRNSEAGRAVMLDDLVAMHDALMQGYKEVLLLSGIDIDAIGDFEPPTKHLPL